MKLGELASRLGAELRGDADLEITGVKGIEEAGPTEITLPRVGFSFSAVSASTIPDLVVFSSSMGSRKR